MRRFTVIVILLSLISIVPLFSLSVGDLDFAYGKWNVRGDRLFQNDLKAGMARVDIPAPQAGMMVYEFNVRYEDGGTDDMHAGFGLHIFVDKAASGKAWGNGKSYLLWLNYDENAKSITKGLSAQLYKSLSNSKMELVADIDLNNYVYLLTEDLLDMVIPVKMVVNGFNGDVKIYDPSDSTYVYKFNLGSTSPLTGRFISLRTNSMGISFGR
jgi:hypothetical protein